MSEHAGVEISEKDREDLTEAAYKMQAAYQEERTWHDAIHKVKAECPDVMLWQLEAMWRAIDAYVDMNE